MVDANGVGVAGVDIDFVNLGSGGNPHEQNDGTDANGNFFTTVDPGVYEVRFFPPAPPATTLLTGVIPSVTIVGTKNVGTITLSNGVSLQGTTKNSSNAPVGGVKVNIFQSATGAVVLLKNNVTSAFGTFNLAVPATALRLDLTTSTVTGQVLVPRRLFVALSGGTNLGTIPLQDGFHVTGTARTQAGAAVAGANLDVVDPVSGDTLFTPGDNTSNTGLFDVVLAAGTYDLELVRPAALALVGVALDGVAISATTNLGVLTMRSGVFLSGTIRDRKGVEVQGADVNVHEVSTGLPVPLGNDNSNAAGFYSVVVPTGLLNVVFAPPGVRNELVKDRHDGVNITANTTLDGDLPGAPLHKQPSAKVPRPLAPSILPFGRGIPGTSGSVPFAQGTPSQGGVTLHLLGGRPGASASLWLGFTQDTLPSDRTLHLVRPAVRVPVRLDEQGAAHVALSRADASLLGRTFFAQFLVDDPEARHRIALSHVLALSNN